MTLVVYNFVNLQVQLIRIQMRVPEYGWTTQKVFHFLNFLVNGGWYLLSYVIIYVGNMLIENITRCFSDLSGTPVRVILFGKKRFFRHISVCFDLLGLVMKSCFCPLVVRSLVFAFRRDVQKLNPEVRH